MIKTGEYLNNPNITQEDQQISNNYYNYKHYVQTNADMILLPLIDLLEGKDEFLLSFYKKYFILGTYFPPSSLFLY